MTPPALDRRPRRADGIDEVLPTSPTHFVEVSGRAIPKVPALRGKTVASLFFEDSTRTRLSLRDGGQAAVGRHDDLLASAARRCKKGESLRDTVETIERHGRRRHRGAPRARPACRGRSPSWVDAAVINAGDGWHEHPTQALLDCYTIRQQLGLARRAAASRIVGDIKHRRVARSNVLAFTRARRRGHARRAADAAAARARRLAGRRSATTSTPCCPTLDVCYLLRMQRERMTEALLPSLREYTAGYGLTAGAGRPLPGATRS